MKKEDFKKKLNFEALTKFFFILVEERYLTTEKLLQLTSKFLHPLPHDIFESLHLRIAVLSAIRNMIKEVSPTRIYRSLQHRDEFYDIVIEALEELEDQLDEEIEKEVNEE